MEFLSRNGIPFVHKDVSEDYQAQQELVELGSMSTPTIKVGDQVMIGFRPAELLKLVQS